jgi:hypothetical protein
MTMHALNIDTNLSRARFELPSITQRARWTGRALSGLTVLFLGMDAGVKFTRIDPVIESCRQLGLPLENNPILGVILFVCLALYVVPRTAALGAVLLTGYLGGAIATHLRVLNPLFSHTLFPVYIGALLWTGLYLRDARVRALLSKAPRA